MQALQNVFWCDANELRERLTPDRCRRAVAEAFRVHATGVVPAPIAAAAHGADGGYHWKAAWWPGPPLRFVAKQNANYPQNPKRHGLPTIQGLLTISDGVTGSLLAMMDSAGITTLRTAAATAVAAERLARDDARTLAIVGCGVQGRAHVPALLAVRPFTRVRLTDANRDAADAMARALRDQHALEVAVVAPDEVYDADVIVTCTPGTAFVLDADRVQPGTFVAGVGTDWEQKRELPPALLARATVVVDVLQQAAVMGDLHHALDAGVMTREDVYAELGSLVVGSLPGRRTPEEIIVFDSTGMALQDAAAAIAVYDAATAVADA